MATDTVEILLRANDNVGPGVDSARRSFEKFQKDVDRGTQSNIDRAIKFGVAVGGIRAGFELAAAGANALAGDTEAAMNALRSLPFGIGGVVSAVEGLVSAFGAAAARAKEVADNVAKIREGGQGERNKLSLLETDGSTQKQILQKQQELEAARAKMLEASLEATKKFGDAGRPISAAAAEEFGVTQKRIAREIADIQAAADEDSARRRMEWRQEEAAILDDMRKKELTERERAAEKQGQIIADVMALRLRSSFSAANAPSLFAEDRMSAAIQADIDAIEEARRRVGGGGGGLPTGDQSRFLTGLAQSAATRLEAQQVTLQQQTVTELKKLNALQQEANQAKQGGPAGPPIILNGGGIFGGLA